ncbi:MAG TPA: inorganic pyrophosphatase [Gammaproteobacteria bacterium]|nr:inorganic pyrophosphatase [Gammaproteobacteria bacterium]
MKPYNQWRPHPWHGLDLGRDAPAVVNAYIEITPFDVVKYEVDKSTGYLRVDRPQRSSAHMPALYGFIPRTYCGERVGMIAGEGIPGDKDPLDICVFSERPISRPEVLMSARVIGGLRMIDGGEADDKIIGVLESDDLWGHARELADLPHLMVERLVHYFSTYKWVPGKNQKVEIREIYGHDKAYEVIKASHADYLEHFGESDVPPEI